MRAAASQTAADAARRAPDWQVHRRSGFGERAGEGRFQGEASQSTSAQDQAFLTTATGGSGLTSEAADSAFDMAEMACFVMHPAGGLHVPWRTSIMQGL